MLETARGKRLAERLRRLPFRAQQPRLSGGDHAGPLRRAVRRGHALLPIFAKDVLHVGPQGLGWLRAAPAVGATLMALIQTRLPPWQQPGRVLLTVVAGYGVATIGLGLSRDFFLSLACLFATGMFDSVSVVIRLTLEQLITPDELRGRVSAIKSVFVGFSNEFGAFESGATAALFGPIASVVGGGFGGAGGGLSHPPGVAGAVAPAAAATRSGPTAEVDAARDSVKPRVCSSSPNAWRIRHAHVHSSRLTAMALLVLARRVPVRSARPSSSWCTTPPRRWAAQARIEAAGVLTLEGTGTQYNLGQDMRPGTGRPDLHGERVQARDRRGRAADAHDADADAELRLLPGAAGANAGAGRGRRRRLQRRRQRHGDARLGRGRRRSPGRALHHPLVPVARRARAGTRTSRRSAPRAAERLVDVTTDAGPITLVVGADGRPTRIQSPGSHINLGDVTLTTTFADYADAGGLQLPTRLATKVDDFTTGTYQVEEHRRAPARSRRRPRRTARRCRPRRP